MKVLKVERLALRLFENSIATTLLFVYRVHCACCCVRLLVYPLLSHNIVVSFHVHKLAPFVCVVVIVALFNVNVTFVP